MKLTEAEFVVLDTETCHLADPKVIELAGVKWRYGRDIRADHFKETFVDPGCKIDPASQAVHHISNDDVAGAPRLEDLHDEWNEWCDGHVLVAYNSDFDRNALRTTPLYDQPWLDLYRAAMHFWTLGDENDDGFPLCSLQQQELRYWLKLPPVMGDAHRAAADIQVTAYLFSRMIDRYLECGMEDDLDAFLAYINSPIMHERFPLGGIMKGKTPEEVPDWALRKAFDPSADQYETFAKFNVHDCLRPEYIRRFGMPPEARAPVSASVSKPPPKSSHPVPPHDPSKSRWKR